MLESLRSAPERSMRSALLTLSHQRAVGRLATRLPVTKAMVSRFVAGESLDAAIVALRRVHDAGLATTIDILGEAVTSADAARAAADAYVTTLHRVAEVGLDRNVSLKLTQMGLAIDPALARENVGRIIATAGEVGAFVRIDMEDHTTTDATLALWRDVRPVDRTTSDCGVVVQAALKRTPADVELLIADRARIRLCKGAYKEPATVAHVDRADVDRAYETLMERLLVEGNDPALATHDERLIRRAIRFAEQAGIGRDRFEFQMLYGVRRDLQERLARAGYRVRVYVPYGHEWYPYFMRRLAERPANVAFLLRSLLREGRGPSSAVETAGRR